MILLTLIGIGAVVSLAVAFWIFTSPPSEHRWWKSGYDPKCLCADCKYVRNDRRLDGWQDAINDEYNRLVSEYEQKAAEFEEKSRTLYDEGYADAINGQRMNPEYMRDFEYQQGYADGEGDLELESLGLGG